MKDARMSFGQKGGMIVSKNTFPGIDTQLSENMGQKD